MVVPFLIIGVGVKHTFLDAPPIVPKLDLVFFREEYSLQLPSKEGADDPSSWLPFPASSSPWRAPSNDA